ncbi:MAG TPA: DNA repair exonuclease [Candidatus Binataceae bacterium]|nr:DNA repair exonuclease [Candidatus Binataceae bacterium]
MIHTSDVHLESDTFGTGQKGDAFRETVRRAFSGVIDLANQRAADLLLIVGDLFDSSRISADALGFAMAQINRARMPVVMIPGNHDAHDERSIYAAMATELMPPNLHLILEPEGRTITFPKLATQLWGRALVEHSPDYRPLMGMPEPVDGQWNIALAHGFFAEDGDTNRSSPILPSEIAASAYDYIALGHVHVFGDVSQGATRAFYCGTPAPLYASSEAGWVAHVNCVPGQPVTIERVRIEEKSGPSVASSAQHNSV